MEYQIPDELVSFLKREIRKELQRSQSFIVPMDITVDRIFQLIAIVASKAIPKEIKPAKSINKIEL